MVTEQQARDSEGLYSVSVSLRSLVAKSQALSVSVVVTREHMQRGATVKASVEDGLCISVTELSQVRVWISYHIAGFFVRENLLTT